MGDEIMSLNYQSMEEIPHDTYFLLKGPNFMAYRVIDRVYAGDDKPTKRLEYLDYSRIWSGSLGANKLRLINEGLELSTKEEINEIIKELDANK
jgi:hypothetical protein